MGLAPAVGGFIIGLVTGVLVLAPAVSAAGTSPVLFAAGAAALAFAAGILLGRRASKPQEIRLTGRVFEFPQGSVMVEVALRRMKSVLPTRVTRSE